MTKMTFTRTLTIDPDDETHEMTLAALEGLVMNARRMKFGDDARVYVMPQYPGTGEFRIGVTDH